VADDAGNLGVDELLGDGRTHLRVCLVVFAHHLELDRLATDLDLLRVCLIEGEVGAVLVVLAEMGDSTRQRTGNTDLDHGDIFRRGLGRLGLFRFFLAAAVHGEHGRRDDGEAELVRYVHLFSPLKRGWPNGQQIIICSGRLHVNPRYGPGPPRCPPRTGTVGLRTVRLTVAPCLSAPCGDSR
jgi:hypothetical protein